MNAPAFAPTIEQEAILAAVRASTANLAIKARAGAAKTTTLVLIAKELPSQSILSIAFNKKIAEELQTRLPDNATAATLNALGHRAWRSFTGKFPKVDGQKTSAILKRLIEDLAPFEQKEVWEIFTDIIDLVSEMKHNGYMPEKFHPAAKPLIGPEEFYAGLEYEVSPLQRELAEKILKISFKLAFEGHIDFDDQLYCPALMPVSFPFYDVIMADEAQDFSRINIALVRKIVRSRRIIAVGDPCQAIYGFRGALETSMDDLIDTFHMQELYLTICFRSSVAVVSNARWRAPDMQWRIDAPEGLVETLSSWGKEDLRDGDAIICRNNAPLFGMALALLRANLLPEVLGSDTMKSLIKHMKSLGKMTTGRAEAIAALEPLREKLSKKWKSENKVNDLIETIHFFLEETETLGAAIDLFESILQRSGKIKLMTGHKSKGLEFDRVWFLDQHLCRIKTGSQDANLKYVIETRARQELRYVNSSDWRG